MTIEDFTKYHDSEFIEHAYRAILKRDPDVSGKSIYLNALRLGEKTKIEILCILRFSSEGVGHNIFIKNLKKHYFRYRVLNLPIVGAIFSLFFILLRLPILVKEINQLHSKNDILLLRLREVDKSFGQVDNNFELTTKTIQEIVTIVDTKASEDDIRLLYQIVATKLDQKEAKIK